MKLLLVRHGETVENKKGLIQGWMPGTLNAKGKLQARKLANDLKKKKIDIIYTSDLSRAYDTALIIAKYHPKIPFFATKLLRERNYGIYQGKSKFNIDWSKMDDETSAKNISNGETISQVQARVKIFLSIMKKKYPDKTILIVGHGFLHLNFISIIKGITLKESIQEGELKNAQVKEYTL